MKEKTVGLLLICLVALSIVYGCSNIVLSSQVTQSKNTVLSRPTTVTEELYQKGKLSYLEPVPLGDPIDDPVPHKD